MADRTRVQLTWRNKDLALLSHGASSYEWVEPSDWRVSEIRLLENPEQVGELSNNLLIVGDALHGLNALNAIPEYVARYKGKVRLCYIDPPFNTKQAFAQYNDNLENSIWLTMFRDRLRQIKPLLSEDGSVWVHLDDNQTHRARAVLDEVFGNENFVTTVVWEKAQGSRNDTDISAAHDYIHVYASNAKVWSKRRNLLPRQEHQLARYQNPDQDPRGPWRQGDNGTAKSGSERSRFPIELPSGRIVTPPEGTYWRFSESSFKKAREEDRVWFGAKGDSMPVIKRYLSEVQDGVVPRTWWPATEVGSNQSAKRDHLRKMLPDRPPFDTPKPEPLLARILTISTDPGDVVLDCFAGSGTTMAVAQKMGRSWVGVEMMPKTVDDYIEPRLQKVIDGTDRGGISQRLDVVPTAQLPDGVAVEDVKTCLSVLRKLIKDDLIEGLEPPKVKKAQQGPVGAFIDTFNTDTEVRAAFLKAFGSKISSFAKTESHAISLWDGGGGYTKVEVADSVFEEIGGRIVLADWATGGELAEAVAAQLRFPYEPKGPFAGRKGRQLLAVIDGMLTESLVDYLLGYAEDDETLVVVAQSLTPDAGEYLRARRKGSRARKIPRDLAHISRRSERHDLSETVVEGKEDA